MNTEAESNKGGFGVVAYLTFLVFALTGICAMLGTMFFGGGVEDLLGDKPLPLLTQWLIDLPWATWLIGYLLAGVAVAIWFEKTERSQGKVTRKMVAVAIVMALITLATIVIGVAAPVFTVF